VFVFSAIYRRNVVYNGRVVTDAGGTPVRSDPQILVFHSLRNTAFGAMMALRAQDRKI
jgi:hypothetical protein